MLWLLVGILVLGGAAALVNDMGFNGQLFDSHVVIRVTVLSSLVLFIGRGVFRRSSLGGRAWQILIWAAVVAAAALLYRWAPA